MQREEFVSLIARREGIPPEMFEQLRIRPYRCKCGSQNCLGWQMIHDAFVHASVVDEVIDAAEVRAYKRQLGKRYVTTPWIFSVADVERDLCS